ncbi:MAG TPA: MoaD/ThiS family protein [Caulobacteraceae bacterium]|jgi:sulfur carrier protein ThiS|nr:MoaD/ThiS family protein [Caulobacteraceae bacterium]
MARIAFTPHLRAVAPTEAGAYPGETLREVIDAVAREFPRLPGYLLDDQGGLRKHIAIFLDGEMTPRDTALDRPLRPESDVFVFQALSGG